MNAVFQSRAIIALRDAEAAYRAAVAEAAQAEDAHAQAEYRVAQLAGDVDASVFGAESKHQNACEWAVRTGAALSIANRAVAATLAVRNAAWKAMKDSQVSA